jgi:hypothetical protein
MQFRLREGFRHLLGKLVFCGHEAPEGDIALLSQLWAEAKSASSEALDAPVLTAF